MSNASMWRTDSPIIAPDGSIQAGGMWDTQRACWNSENYIKAFLAGYGCVAANTKIRTENGLMRICDIDRPMRVVSWNAVSNQYHLSLTGGAFPKDAATLYRVTTKRGEFDVTAHHHVLCEDGKYRRVADLSVGDELFSATFVRRSIHRVKYPLSWHVGALHSMQIAAGSMGRYADAARRYGQRLLVEKGIDLASSPSRDDVQVSHQDSYPVHETVDSDDLSGMTQAHTHRDQSYGHSQKRRSEHPLGHPVGDAEGCTTTSHPARTSAYRLGRLRSVSTYVYRRIIQPLVTGVRSLSLLKSYRRHCAVPVITSIEELPGTYAYWDMQVLDTNNYVTEDGCVHHNSGKSMLLGKRVIASALHNAPVPVMMVSPSYRQAKRTIIPTLLSLLNGRKITYKYNRADATVDITHQGVTGHIWIGSGDTPDSLKGSNLGAVYADEAFMLDYSVIEICLSRIRDPRAKLRELFLCGTPENGVTGWAYDMLEGAKRKNFDIGVYQASTLENKALPKEFVESLLAAYDEKTREAYVHGKLVNMSSGTIYGSFDKERHVRSVPVPRDAEVVAGVDFNFDPACAVLFYEDGAGRMMVFDEVHMTGGHDTFELADEVWQKSHGLLTTFFPDPSGTQRKTSARVGTTDITILQQAGMRLRDDGKPFEVRARRRTPPRRDRYNAANSMLREDRIVIDPRCEHLIKSLMMGTYEGFSKHDGYDHQCFSGDTVVETRDQGFVKMRDMSLTGFVRGPTGSWAAYTNGGVVRKPNAQMIQSTVSNGAEIISTPDHLFMTMAGIWIEAQHMAGITCKALDAYDVAIIRTKVVPNEDAYCPTVTNEGCFILNDIIVSNSDSFSYYIELTNPITNKVQNSRQWY